MHGYIPPELNFCRWVNIKIFQKSRLEIKIGVNFQMVQTFMEEENNSDEYFWDANSISDKTSYSQELIFIFLGWDVSGNRLPFHFIYSKYNFISSEIWMSVVVSVIVFQSEFLSNDQFFVWNIKSSNKDVDYFPQNILKYFTIWFIET